MTIGDGCHLYLGKEGKLKSITGGLLTKLSVGPGGEVTPTTDLVNENSKLNITVSVLFVVNRVQ